jgi:hypothetical protein
MSLIYQGLRRGLSVGIIASCGSDDACWPVDAKIVQDTCSSLFLLSSYFIFWSSSFNVWFLSKWRLNAKWSKQHGIS